MWASGTGGTVLRTTNGGDEWRAVGVPGAQQLDFRDVDAFSDRAAYVLSIGNGDASRIYRTSDGGGSWTLQLANTDPKVFLDAMAFWTPERGVAYSDSVVAFAPRSKSSWIAVGSGGADVSHDDGRTWIPLPGAGFDAFSFSPRGRVGWGAGARGSIGRLEGF